ERCDTLFLIFLSATPHHCYTTYPSYRGGKVVSQRCTGVRCDTLRHLCDTPRCRGVAGLNRSQTLPSLAVNCRRIDFQFSTLHPRGKHEGDTLPVVGFHGVLRSPKAK